MAEVILFFPKLKEDEPSALLPLNLLVVAAPLVEKGVAVRIIDQRVDTDWQKHLIEELKMEPRLVGFTCLAGQQILYGLEASRLVKERSKAAVVWGGVHASMLPEQAMANPLIDFVVIGEGEQTLLNLYERLKQNQNFDDVGGLAYKKDGKFFINQSKEFLNMDALPKIPYHLVEMEKYIANRSFASGRPARNIFFCTSRGCPHNCGFCYNQAFNKRRWRGMGAERVVAELKRLNVEYGVNAFDLEDDEFFVDLERVKKVSELILANKLKIEIFVSCRLNYLSRMSDDFLKLIRQAGFVTLAFGVETGSERILKLTDKEITIAQIFEAVDRLKKFGIESKYYFMVGFPTESIQDICSTTDLIQKMKRADPFLRIPPWRFYTPYINTDLWNLSINQGFNPPNSLEDWAKFEYNVINMPWLKLRQRMIIKNVSFFWKYLEIGKSPGKGVFFFLAQIYGKTVDWRWQRHLFTFVPEKYFIIFFLGLKRRIFS